MKIRLITEGEDYLILFLMLIAGIIAALGLYAGISELIKWLSGFIGQYKFG